MNKRERKKVNNWRGIMGAALAVILLVSIFPVTVKAEGAPTWVPLGDGWHQLEGTDVKVEVKPGTVHVTGTGALPNYGYWDLKKRPWATNECEAVTIDGSITSIGAYNFFDLPKLKYINISSTTFITDYTSFYKNDQRPIFRIGGSAVTTEMIGTIPYTSMDSIKAIAQSNYTGAAYVLDSNALASAFQGSTNPTLRYVYSAEDGRAPWNDLVTYGNGDEYTSICKLAPNQKNPVCTVRGMKRYQGKACYQAFATAIGDYTFGATFDVVVTANDANKTKISRTNTPLQYVLTVPEEFVKSGRSFKLMAIGEGQVLLYDDQDADGKTVTFTTDYPSTAYALVYKN